MLLTLLFIKIKVSSRGYTCKNFNKKVIICLYLFAVPEDFFFNQQDDKNFQCIIQKLTLLEWYFTILNQGLT